MTSDLALLEGGRPASAGPSGAAADRRLSSLTGLRFVAALLVFGFHIQAVHVFRVGSVGDAVTGHVFGNGAIGVSFFFILSGFVLTWSAGPNESAGRVWRKRAAKIYPNHLVTAVIALVSTLRLSAVLTGGTLVGSTRFAAVLPNLLLVQAWDPDPDVYFGLNTVSWSLSCEAMFYLCFPLLFRSLSRVGDKALWPLAGALAALVWCLPLVTLAWSPQTAYWFIYVFPPTRTAEFCLGMVLARIVRAGRWIRLPARVSALLLAAAYAAIGYLPARVGYVAVTVVPLALLVAGLAAADLRGNSPWATRRMVRLGEISFAFYLVHQLVIRYTVKIMSKTVGDPGTWGVAHSAEACAAMLATSLLAAWALYHTVEHPLNRRLRPGGGARPAQPGSETAVTRGLGVAGHHSAMMRRTAMSRRLYPRRSRDLD